MKDFDSILAGFPEIQPDERPGYQGYVVPAEKLTDFVSSLRQDAGYPYLSCITGVDYPAANQLEVVYHLRRLSGGVPLELKVKVPREDAHLPSLVPQYLGADFQEREAYDLLGIRFDGHPNLKRILLWDEFTGHPLRKDWKEPFFEADAKPFKSRWPDGNYKSEEDRNPFHNNVHYPMDFDPGKNKVKRPPSQIAPGIEMEEDDTEIGSEHLVVNLGPQHPSTHGVFRMLAELDGETVLDVKPIMGYLHRNHEKIAERNTYLMNMPYTDRLDYISSLSNNFGYALAVEKLAGITPTERAEYIRVMMAELTRIVSHLIAVGFLMNDLGVYFTASLYGLEERELILDIFQAVTGSRMMCNYLRFGGVARDIPEDILGRIRELVYERLPRKVDDFEKYVLENEIVRSRCQGVGVLSPQQAIAYSAAGPMLRASGVPFDLRKAEPYSIYGSLEFDVAVASHGDVFDRTVVRLAEMRQSLRILRQVLEKLPQGPIMPGKSSYNVRVPVGESYGAVEGPKGELGFYLVSDGSPNPYRYHVRPPCFINLTGLGEMSRGEKIADLVIILGAVDIVLGEVDR